MPTEEPSEINVDQLNCSQAANVGTLIKMESRLQPIMETPPENLSVINVATLSATEPKLNALSDKLMKLCDQIRASTTSEDELNIEQEKCDELQFRLNTLLYSMSACVRSKEQHDAIQLQSPHGSAHPAHSLSISYSTGIKLPKLDLPKFNGKYTNGRPFIELHWQ